MYKMMALLAAGSMSIQVFAQTTSPDPVLWNYSGAGGVQILTFEADPIESWRGSINVYDETSSEPWITIQSPYRFDLFGAAKSSAGDIDGDGFDDIIIGAPLAGPNSVNPGRAHVYSGATGQELLRFEGFGKNDFFGRSVAGAGDVNGDEVPDVLIAGWYHSERGTPYGRVYLLSGADGKLLRTITSYEADDGFGYTITSLGDLNGDGVHEIAIAAPLAETLYLGTGSVYIFDLAANPFKHITTSNALATINNDSVDRDYFGSILAYDDQYSTSDFDAILVGSIDTVSYEIGSAQFVFSHHKISGDQTDLGSVSVPGQLEGDAIPDGKVSNTDVSAATISDVDGDGQVTVSDVALVISNFGESSPVQDLVSDPSPILSRMAELTTGGQLNVIPGEPQPWDDPCDNDDDGGGGGGQPGDVDSDTRPDVQPPYPGNRPWCDTCCGSPTFPACRVPSDPPTNDDGCDDDPPPPDDGGGGDTDCNTCDEGNGGDCLAFLLIDRPRYVGRGLQLEFESIASNGDWELSLTGTGEEGVYLPSVSRVGSTNRFAGTASFVDEAMTTSLKWVATNTVTGARVTKCFDIDIVDYDNVEFVYKTFIPCEVVSVPLSNRPAGMPPFFAGDDRYICNTDSSVMGYLQGRSRSIYLINIQCNSPNYNGTDLLNREVDCDITGSYPNELTSELNEFTNGDTGFSSFGTTTAYWAGSAAPTTCNPIDGASVTCDYELVNNPTVAGTGILPTIGTTYTRTDGGECFWDIGSVDGTNGGFSFRLLPNTVRFHYRLHARNPLMPTLFGIIPTAPAIDVQDFTLDLEWKVDKVTGRQTVNYVMRGTADGFPSHESYIEHNPEFIFDAAAAGNTPFLLFPPTNITISRSGTITP